jgi:hypothetical protein
MRWWPGRVLNKLVIGVPEDGLMRPIEARKSRAYVIRFDMIIANKGLEFVQI